ncbi:MAG TPA: GNAT family N-acetyltransferase [Nocardioidaceae bacterium]|nr:GNAT family N-acetyltransferase [Nocardioidaceae bacterium]
MTTIVRDNPAESRYEIHEDDRLVGFTEYKLGAGRIAFIHTEVDPTAGGRGLGRQLVREELEDARRRGLAVLPFCPYVRKVIADDPDRYLDLVRTRDRDRFGLADGKVSD